MGEDLEVNNEGVSQKSEKELVKLCQRRLENWREVLIHVNSLFLWEKSFYPGIIIGFVTFVFILLWYFEPSILTAVAVLGIVCCILDYIVPILSSSVFDSRKWTGSEEHKYEELCRSFVQLYLGCRSTCDSVSQIKESKPKLYFVGVLGLLVLTAWIGNWINNLFLVYLLVLSAALLPGIKSHGVIQQNFSKAVAMIKGMTAQKKKKK